MSLEPELRTLAELEWGGPVLSVYADARWRDEAQRERLRVFWHQARDKAAEAGASERLIAPIDGAIGRLLEGESGPRAMAWFSSASQYVPLALPASPPLAARWDEGPMLLPLCGVSGASVRALAVVAGAKTSHLYELLGDSVTERLELHRDDFPGRHRSGPNNVERHVEEHLRWQLRAVAGALAIAFDREPCPVFVCAAPAVRAAFLALVPARVRARTRALPDLQDDPLHEQQEVQHRVAAALVVRRLEEALALEEQAYREAMGSGAGALGAQEVVLALQEGRVHELLIRDGLECYGAECLRCGGLDIKRMTGCSYCGGEVRLGNLAEAIVRRALLSGAHVRVMPDAPRHPGVGGLAAVLRPRRGARLPLGTETRPEEWVVGKGA